jgi:chemotaxis protein methyltransferase CheR
MNKELQNIVQVISQTLGRDVSLYDESFLVKSLETRLQKTANKTPSAYLAYLAENKAEAEGFFRSLNITYSEFFRGRLAFALLEHIILPRLVEEREQSSRAELRIWSAGCADGQEAYSIAMLLHELATIRGTDIPFRIFATDTSAADLVSARNGMYDAGALQNVTMKHVRTYFAQQGGIYVIDGRLRDRIDFSLHDLLDEHLACPPASIFGDFDLIMCCNLLIYYRPDVRRFILNKMWRCLIYSGYLVTGEAERGIVEQTVDFQAVVVPAAVFRRSGRRR